MASATVTVQMRLRGYWLVRALLGLAEIVLLFDRQTAIAFANWALRYLHLEYRTSSGRWQPMGPLDLEAS